MGKGKTGIRFLGLYTRLTTHGLFLNSMGMFSSAVAR